MEQNYPVLDGFVELIDRKGDHFNIRLSSITLIYTNPNEVGRLTHIVSAGEAYSIRLNYAEVLQTIADAIQASSDRNNPHKKLREQDNL